jgi:hypothetical protein
MKYVGLVVGITLILCPTTKAVCEALRFVVKVIPLPRAIVFDELEVNPA